MRMQCPYSKQPSFRAAALGLLLATALSGCASKNPLMEDATPVAQKAKSETTPAKMSAETATATEKPAASAEPAIAAEPAAPEAAAASATSTSTSDTATNNTTVEQQNAAANEVASVASDKPAKVGATEATAAAKTDTAAEASTNSSVRTEKEKRFLGFLSPYRPDVQQGNFVSREMVAQLRVGMTPNQVVFLLGTPLLNDIFHQNRWDYVFRMQKGNGEITTSNVTIYFENGLVSRFEGGGDLPTEADYLARIADKAKAAKK